MYGTGTNYTDIISQPNGNRTIYLPNYAGNMYLIHGSNNNAIGGAETMPVYIAANGRATAITKVNVAHGGTGATSFTANSVIMSGSSTTAALTTRAVTNNTSNTAITASTNIPTMNTIYYGLAAINNASQSRAVSVYAPTSAGTKN
jgi:hypothetical protein